MPALEISAWYTVLIAIVVLYIGWQLNRRLGFLERFNIPEAVSSGLLVSVIIALIYVVTGRRITFDLFFRDILLLVFFTTVGLSAQFRDLLTGGRPLVVLLLASTLLILVQNFLGVFLAKWTGLSAEIGLLAGSISLVGGMGTSIAWGELLSKNNGVPHATEIGVACATIGLIMGGLAGGPTATWLIRSGNLKPAAASVVVPRKPHEQEHPLSENSFLYTVLVVAMAISIGTLVHRWLEPFKLRLPAYVPCMFAGIVLSNVVTTFFPKLDWPTRHESLNFISETSLMLFLTMSLMSLQLWKLVSLAAPLTVILVVQLLAAVLFIRLVLFRWLGASYDAAVLSAGFLGFTLGATPNAIANMTSVTSRYGPSPMAFIIVPLVGGFFIDLVNAILIEFFLMLMR